MRAPLALSFACAAAVAAAAQSPVFVVGKQAGPGVDFTDIATAVAAVPEGAVVLVKGGTYDEAVVVDGKAVILTADTGAEVILRRPLYVRNLGATQQCVVRGFKCRPNHLFAQGAGMEIQSCAGPVWVEDGELTGSIGEVPLGPSYLPQPGCRVVDSQAATFVRCEIGGGWIGFTLLSLAGAPGLDMTASTVAMHGCGSRGSASENSDGLAGELQPGGAGARVSGGSLFAERSTFQGGDGSFCFPSPFFTYEGAGGPGIHLASSVPVVHLFGGSAVGGQHGCHQSSAAPIVISSGSVVQIPGSPRAFQIPSPLREGQVAALAFTGLAGDLAFLGLSFVPAHFPVFDVLSGVLHLGAPIDVLPMGVVPPSGSLAFPILVPELGPGVEAFLWRIQAGFLSADFASAVLADPAAPVLIDVGL